MNPSKVNTRAWNIQSIAVPATRASSVSWLARVRDAFVMRMDASMQHLRDWAQRRRDAVAFGELDARTLRDLGLSRSEVESFRMEADDRVIRTRRHVVRGSNRLHSRVLLPE